MKLAGRSLKQPIPIGKIAVRLVILRCYMGHQLTDRGYMSRREKKFLTEQEKLFIEGAHYCRNFDPQNYMCIQCVENEEGKYLNCYRKG